MRLRDLGLTVGSLPTGPLNTITDVPGARVGHARGAVGGVTIVLPFADAPRRYYAGRWSLDGAATTGLPMLEDFGALSTPIAMAPAPAVGRVYDGLLDYGFGIDDGLGEDQGWPPAVLAIDGVPGAVSQHASLGAAQVSAALSTATTQRSYEGQVGAGAGLISFGYRAGIGSASRRIDGVTVAVLLATNGGELSRLAVNGVPVGRFLARGQTQSAHRHRSVVAVLLTDAPALPGQLDHLAQRASFGLVRVGLLDEHTQGATILAVSTTGLDDETEGLMPGTVGVRALPAHRLPVLAAAAADVCEEAVLNALIVAAGQPVTDDTPSLSIDAFRTTATP